MLSLVRSLKAPAPAGLVHANLYSTVSGLTRRTWRTGSHPAPQSVHDDVRAADADAGADTGAAPPLRRTAHKVPTPHAHKAHRTTLKKAFPDGWAPPRRLSREAMDGLRAMHAADPEMFATPVLAERFRISPEAVRRILKSRWEPTREQRVRIAERERRAKEEWIQERRMEEREQQMEIEREAARPPRGRKNDRLTFTNMLCMKSTSHASHALVPQKARPFGGPASEDVVPVRAGQLSDSTLPAESKPRTTSASAAASGGAGRGTPSCLHRSHSPLRRGRSRAPGRGGRRRTTCLPPSRERERHLARRPRGVEAPVRVEIRAPVRVAEREHGVRAALADHAPSTLLSVLRPPTHHAPPPSPPPLADLAAFPLVAWEAHTPVLREGARETLIPQRTYEGGQGPPLLESLCSFKIADCPALGISLDLLERFASLASSQLVDADLPAFHDSGIQTVGMSDAD
ncbi:predicted protein [Postia placenta Mad-698-R]|nr:predicted protein [Postia placenta Mad-698-R]